MEKVRRIRMPEMRPPALSRTRDRQEKVTVLDGLAAFLVLLVAIAVFSINVLEQCGGG